MVYVFILYLKCRNALTAVSYLVSDIDYCINVTCKNGGSCVDGLDNYTCSCVAGFSGVLCETGTAETTIMLVETIKSQWHRV